MVKRKDAVVVARGRFSRGKSKLYDYFVPEEFIRQNGLNFAEWTEAEFYDHKGAAIVNTPYEREAKFFVEKILINPSPSENKANKFLVSLNLKDVDYVVLHPLKEDQKLYEKEHEIFSIPRNDNVGFNLYNNSSNGGTEIFIKKEKGKNSMKKMFKNIKGFDNIGMVDGVFGLSFMDNKLAVKVGESFFSFDKETGVIIDASNFAMELPLPAMVLPAQVSELKIGDIILHEGQYVFVKETGEDTVTIITVGGEQKTKTLVKNALMGNMNFVEKLTSPFGDAFTTQNQNGGNIFANPMMMMAMMDGKDGDSDDMFKMMMMGQMMNGMQSRIPAVKPSDN